MQLGLFTACLPASSLEDLARWAAPAGFTAIEAAAWPNVGPRPFTATHVDVDRLDEATAADITAMLDGYGLSLSSLSFYDNNLHPDPAVRAAVNAHLESCIRAAAILGCPTVGTFVGRDPGRSVAENLRTAEALFPRYVDLAGELGVKVVIENCVMEGWHPDGYPGNLAYSPELWEWMFSLGLFLNYDPSHLVWMGIDPVAALVPYVDRVAHVQAKDIQVFPERRNRYGYPGRAVTRTDPWDTGYWRFRIPGRGDVDWPALIGTLDELGYRGTVSVEHEDPTCDGTEEGIKEGLLFAWSTLAPLIDVAAPAVGAGAVTS